VVRKDRRVIGLMMGGRVYVAFIANPGVSDKAAIFSDYEYVTGTSLPDRRNS